MNSFRITFISICFVLVASFAYGQDTTALSIDDRGVIQLGAGKMEINSTAVDNFNIKTNSSTPNPNFYLGVGDGSGGTLHQPIMWNHMLILNGSGNAWAPTAGVPVSEKNRADMVITGDGKVGIGVQYPGGKLEVGLNEAFTGKLIRAIGHSNDPDAANLEIGDGGTIFWRLLRLTNNTFQTKMSGSWSISDKDGMQIVSFRRTNPNANVDKRGITFDVNSDFTDRSIYVDVGKDPKNSGAMFFRTHRSAYVADYRFEDYTGEVHHKLNNKGNSWFNAFEGNVGIGTVQPTEKLHVIGKINTTGGVIQSSDKRLKNNFQTIENALDKISVINGVSFEWTDSSMGEKREIGVIAQEVESVFPEAVVDGQDGYKSVNYSSMIAPLIEAVKTLKNKNEILSQENAALKSQNRNIEERLLEIESFIDSLK